VTDKQAASVVDAFERALGDIRTRVCASMERASGGPSAAGGIAAYDLPEGGCMPERIAIAYSGGLDSSVLLQLAHAYASAHDIALFAFHIHHGISPNADHWLMHCERECARLGIVFDARRVKLANTGKSGTEEAARISRYAALGDLCRAHRVSLLLTAHHQDDQAETVLLQLLRGSGVAGLSGMDAANTAPDLLGDTALVMGRPLLTVARAELADFAAQKGIAYIEDESNSDTRYARNALRHQVMPVLAASFPGFQQRFARSAQHAQSAQRLLIDYAAQDLAACLDGDCIDIAQLKRFSTERIDNLLRYWFGARGIRMPSTAWLNEMRTQLLEAKADAQLCVTHADCHIRRHRDRIFLTPKLERDPSGVPSLSFRWNGEANLHFASFGGALHFDVAEQGVGADWLRGKELLIRYRQGGERLKPAFNRPTKSLKYHYQALDVPAWERQHLPVVIMENDLLFAAGIGMDCRHFDSTSGVAIRLRWQMDSI
jgi:tRNA(Ile)-lysidine synthase